MAPEPVEDDDAISNKLIDAVESVKPMFALMMLREGASGAFKSAYVSGIWLGLEIAVGDVVAGRRLIRWLEEHIPNSGHEDEDRNFVNDLRKILLETP